MRVRTKNNSFVYGKQSMFQTAAGGPDGAIENLLWQKKRAT